MAGKSAPVLKGTKLGGKGGGLKLKGDYKSGAWGKNVKKAPSKRV